jgi:ABC-type Mn2+/Zn2+ transport system ATPase subunit
MVMSALYLHDLTLGYERHPAVHHLDGAFNEAQITAVVGPNGSGKSTLLKGLAGALTPLSGRVDRGAIKPNQIAYLPQDHGVDRDFPMTLGELVALGLWRRRGLFGGVTHQDHHRIEAAMGAVDAAQSARMLDVAHNNVGGISLNHVSLNRPQVGADGKVTEVAQVLGLDWQISQGQRWLVSGASGAGTTALGSLIVLLFEETKGALHQDMQHTF